MSNIKKSLKIMKYNLKTLIIFEMIFKLLSFLIFMPLFIGIFNLIMKVTGYKYITFENIGNFILNPITIILVLILILLMMVYTMFDITSIIIILDNSYHKTKVHVKDVIITSIKKCKSMFSIKNILLAVLILFIIPFLHVGVASSFITTIKIPEFILDFIINNRVLFIVFLIAVAFLLFLLLRWMYSIHYFVLENLSFKEARKRSINLSKGNHIKDFITMILVQLSSLIIYFLIVALGGVIIFLLNKLLSKIIIVNSILTTIVWVFIAISFVCYTLLSVPISYSAISVLYYLRKNERKETIKAISVNKSNKSKILNKILSHSFTLLILLTLVFGSIFTYGVYKGKYNLNIEYVRTLEVTAHRGASVSYPENTMSAFIGAKKLGADWIELDVQQTKDGNIIVIHDTNLKRTTNINKDTWQVMYDDIKDVDAGSFFDEKYKNEKIPLLKDVIAWAKDNNMKLNIELKPTGKENNFEKNVVDIVTDMNYENYCVITSQVYSVLQNVKKYNNKIKTVYVMSLFYGNIKELKDADHFSIEASNVNKTLVKEVHNEGKQIYVWTVNTKDNIKKMIDLKVDNIITDNITLAKDTIYESKTSNLINEYIKFVEKIF